MATSTLRFALIVALVVGGVVLIDQAFPKGGTAAPAPGTSTSPSASPSVSPSASPSGTPSPQIVGVRIGVFNGTAVTGLASETAITLENDSGYVPAQVTDAPSPVAVTTLYYRNAQDRAEAKVLAADFFKDLEVKISRLPASATNVLKRVQVAIYLGNDYASAQG